MRDTLKYFSGSGKKVITLFLQLFFESEIISKYEDKIKFKNLPTFTGKAKDYRICN